MYLPFLGGAEVSLMNRVNSMILLNLSRKSYLLARWVGIGKISGSYGKERKWG